MISRRCLEVFAHCRQPLSIVTKIRLILRDLDLLRDLAAHDAVGVALSLTSLDAGLSARMEPRAAAPADRLETIRRLKAAGVPVGVLLAPVIPSLNDVQIPALLAAAADAGARWAGYVLLRLPHQVKDLFGDWLRRNFPQRAAHVESQIRQTHGGQLYDARFGVRQLGEGPLAQHIGDIFRVCAARSGLAGEASAPSGASFRRPCGGQMNLFFD